jgi:hypothetical protein
MCIKTRKRSLAGQTKTVVVKGPGAEVRASMKMEGEEMLGKNSHLQTG